MTEGFDEYVVEPRDAGDAEEGTELRLGAFPNPDLELCPVTPLGFLGSKVVFAMPEGEIRMELASKIGSMLRTDIFACQAGQSFLTTWRDSDDKFQRDLATVWFVRQCRSAGLWDVNRTVRSLGVWPGPGDAVVLHKGDEVLTIPPKGKMTTETVAQALRRRSGPLYKLHPPAPAPTKAASIADGQWARQALDCWRWEAIGDEGLTGADAAIGWVGAAMLGGFAPFRGHLMLDALQGSGKTTLIAFVHALMSALAGDVIDAFSEPGLRGELAGMARPVLIDEAEGGPTTHGPGPVERALELLRRMSTGSGGTRKMGDVGGGAVTQTAVGAALLAAINAPRLGPADATRFVQVRLLPLNAPVVTGQPPRPLATDEDLKASIAKAQALAPHILGRVLKLASRYRADVSTLKAALSRQGQSPRTADLLAMLAAGRRLLLADEALDAEAAEAEVAFWQPLLDQRADSEAISNPGQDAFAHLMSAPSGKHVKDRVVTIGELVQACVGQVDADHEEALKACGVKFAYGGKTGQPELLVANHHPALERIFGPTKWQDWRRALSYLDALGPEYATAAAPAQRFGLIQQRAIAVPLAPWLGRRPVPSQAVTPGVPAQGDDFDE